MPIWLDIATRIRAYHVEDVGSCGKGGGGGLPLTLELLCMYIDNSDGDGGKKWLLS